MGVLDHPVDGTPGNSPAALLRPDDLVVAIGRFLWKLHHSEPDATVHPTATDHATPSSYVAAVRDRLERGVIDREQFDEPYRPHDPARLVGIAADLADRLDDLESPAPVHGALALADLRIDGGMVVGWAMPDRPRVGDPYVDLAFLARDLAAAIGPAAVPALFDASGIDRPDPVRIEFWVTVRQLL